MEAVPDLLDWITACFVIQLVCIFLDGNCDIQNILCDNEKAGVRFMVG